MTATVLVTGAGGFIGSVLVRRLREAGFEVRAGLRRPAEGGTACNLDHADEVLSAVAGVDCVVHAAYGMTEAMTAQCATLLAAMGQAGVSRLIHFSSIAVHGDATGVIAESAAPLTPNDGYGAAKIACEAEVRGWAGAAGGMRRALILRPGIVYGARSPFWIDKMTARIRQGVWGTFGPDGAGTAALVHVEDVADLVVAAVQRMTAPEGSGLPKVMTAHVIGPETPSWNAYFSALAEALGVTLLELSPATVRLRQALAMPAKIWRRLGLPGGAGLALVATPGEIVLFGRAAVYLMEVAPDLFSYAPRIGLKDGLARALAQPKS